MVLFCKYKDVSRENRQFTVGSHWDAHVVLDEDTPFSLGLKDGDEIFVRLYAMKFNDYFKGSSKYVY